MTSPSPMSGSSQQSPAVPHFAAFAVLPRAFKGSRDLRSRHMLWGFVVLAVILSVCWIAEGTFGPLRSFQPIQDFERAFSFGHPLASSTQFPFVRDLPSWILLFVLVMTVTCVHHQWRLLSTCIGELVDSEALKLRAQPVLSKRQRFIVERIAHLSPDCSYESFANWMNEKLLWVSRMTAIWFIIAFVLALLLARGERTLGMFEILDRPGASPGALARFSKHSYAGWWASSGHPIGSWTYIVLVAIGIYVILLQNVVGMAAMGIASVVSGFFETGVDWFDRDGGYGWRPLANVYRTVRWGLGMDGIAFTILFVIVGFDEWRWMFLLFSLWLIVLPIYLGVPSMVFRHVGIEAKNSALAEIGAASASMSENKIQAIERASETVPYIRNAVIRPLRLSRFGPYALFVAVVLPTLLAILEALSQLHSHL